MTAYKVYLDVCCLNRPFDVQGQSRIRLESEAILLIMTRLQSNEWLWIGSDAINYEVGQIPNLDRRNRINVLISAVHHTVILTQIEAVRAKELQSLGFKQWDALHLACAESGQADIFLTTDDKFLRLSRRIALKVRVENPLNWLTEVIE